MVRLGNVCEDTLHKGENDDDDNDNNNNNNFGDMFLPGLMGNVPYIVK
jgi:hypothetical protein